MVLPLKGDVTTFVIALMREKVEGEGEIEVFFWGVEGCIQYYCQPLRLSWIVL